MNAFLYGVLLQWRLDIRSRALLITCYVVPLLFFLVMGGIFTSLTPESGKTLIPSMTVMGVSMGALIGLPPSLAEVYGSGMKKMYRANGVPLFQGAAAMCLSAFLHLTLMSLLICLTAPALFEAAFPEDPLLYFAGLAVFTAVSLSVGCALGFLVKHQAKLTMLSQLVFLPSILLSGIMFPSELLPPFLETAGKLFPAFWGYRMMCGGEAFLSALPPLLLTLAAAILFCAVRLRALASE